MDINLSIEVKEINQAPVLQVSEPAITMTWQESGLDLHRARRGPGFAEKYSHFFSHKFTQWNEHRSIGRITWDTTIQDLGDHTVVVKVCDDFNPAACVSESFYVTVIEASVPL